MTNNTQELKVSKDFTIDDIHKIREWNYERTKDATFDEYIQYVENSASSFLCRVEEARAKDNETAPNFV